MSRLSIDGVKCSPTSESLRVKVLGWLVKTNSWMVYWVGMKLKCRPVGRSGKVMGSGTRVPPSQGLRQTRQDIQTPLKRLNEVLLVVPHRLQQSRKLLRSLNITMVAWLAPGGLSRSLVEGGGPHMELCNATVYGQSAIQLFHKAGLPWAHNDATAVGPPAQIAAMLQTPGVQSVPE